MKNITNIFDVVEKLEEYRAKKGQYPIKILLTNNQFRQLKLLQSQHESVYFDYQRKTFQGIPVSIDEQFELQ